MVLQGNVVASVHVLELGVTQLLESAPPDQAPSGIDTRAAACCDNAGARDWAA